MKSRKNVPSEREMQKIPRWARVALAARTLRCVQPLLLASWPKATRKYQRGVEWAIAEGESAATQGSATPDLHEAGMAAMEVCGDEPLEAIAANFLTFGAARVSFGAQQSNASDARVSLDHALSAAEMFERERAATLEAIWHDFQQLVQASKRDGWNDRTPVPPAFFGPTWPSEPPQHLPAVPITRPKAARKARRHQALTERGAAALAKEWIDNPLLAKFRLDRERLLALIRGKAAMGIVLSQNATMWRW